MNIDAKLRSGSAKPGRPLHAAFTRNIITHITAYPRPPRLGLKGIVMKLLDKPALALAGIVAAFVMSGTAYAAVVNWPNIQALFGGEQQTTQGRVVKVDTENCHTDNAFTMTKPKDQRGGPRYFMIKQGSKFTNEQVTQMVLGDCEQGAQSDVLFNQMKQNYHGDNLVGGYIDNLITAITPTSITLEADIPIGEEIKHVTKVFNRIDPNVQVYYKADTLAFGDLKVGDHVAVAYRAEGDALYKSETMSPEQLDTNQVTVVLVVKNTPNAAKAIEFQKYLGSEFKEVVPCSTNETGYCGVQEYYENKAKQQS